MGLASNRMAAILGSTEPAKSEAAQDRAMRIIEAASILGCNSAALTPAAQDTDDMLERTAVALKRLMANIFMVFPPN